MHNKLCCGLASTTDKGGKLFERMCFIRGEKQKRFFYFVDCHLLVNIICLLDNLKFCDEQQHVF